MSLTESKLSRVLFPKTRPITYAELRPRLRLGSLENITDMDKAVQIIKGGHPVAGQMHGVFGLLIRGDSHRAAMEALTMKGEENLNKPFSSMMATKDFVSLVDHEILPPVSQKLLENIPDLQRRIGAICHIRAPVRPDLIKEHQVPSSLLSYQAEQPYMQNLDPFGHRSMSRFVEKLKKEGISYIGVTSLNDKTKGEAEITQSKRAIRFCREKGVPLLLKDPQHTRVDVRGSFAIIDLENLTAIRDGHVPIKILEKILKVTLDKTDMKPANYPPPPYFEIDSDPEFKRAAVILRLKGFSNDETRERLENTLRALDKTKS